jgi:hypothetical protein
MGQSPLTPSPTPPSCSECTTKMQPTGGGPPTQSASRLWRSSDGKTRVDTATTSVISDPTSQKTILLDHTNKEASIIPMKPPVPAGAPPTTPQAPAGAGQAPPMQVQDLGKSMIEGHEVEGKRFTMPSPPSPPMPSAPQAPQAKMPGLPQVNMPGMPQAKIPGAPPIPGMPPPPSATAPGAPQPPKPPQAPPVAEVWTSVKLKVPVLTKVTLPTGEQTTYCKPTSTAEPHPSLFQIPPGYKIKPKP